MARDIYRDAITLLINNEMPVIVPADDGLHLFSVVPTDDKSYEVIFGDDADRREMFCARMVSVFHDELEARDRDGA